MTDVAIVVVNWNTRDLTLGCGRAVRERVRDATFSLTIVDNGSTDGSVQAFRSECPEAQVLENGSNLGFARAVNRGVDASPPSEFILLLNSDAEVQPGAVETLVRFLRSHQEVGAAGPQLLDPDGSPQNSTAPFPSLLGELLNKSLLRVIDPDRFLPERAEYPDGVPVDSVIGAAMMIRREAWDQVGPLDQDYFVFLEETDWCWRARKAGHRIMFVPGAKVIHGQGKSRGAAPVRARIEYWRSLYTFFRKRRGGIRYLMLRTLRPMRLLISWAFSCIFTVLTLGLSSRWRRRAVEYTALLLWHACACPAEMGLQGRPAPGR